jgi:hypothetical protein
VDDYYPFQNELPCAYGVGEAGLPDNAGPTREAQARQWSGYLMLFEQLLSDTAAQIGSVNRLFSSNPDERSTYFTRPLFDLPGAGHLLRGAPAADGPLWDAWVVDPANPYALALQGAVEDADRSLDRRNRMLDHLMARQGEQMIAWGQELHRRSRRELTDGGAPPEALAGLLEERRRAVNARLIRDKASFLAELPALNAARLQALGDPLKYRPELLAVTRGETGHQWTISLDGAPLLRGTQSSLTAPGAAFAAEAAVLLASQPGRYEQVPADGDRVRLNLLDGDQVLGESIDTWESSAQAQTALEDTSARFSRLRIQESATPLERRVCHLTGIRIRQRRRLLLPLDEHFEIFDQAPSGSDPQLRWHLREGPGAGGGILLLSASHFEDGEDGSAQEQAEASIDRALRLGLDEWNYRITDTGGGSHVCELRDPTGNALALSDLPLASESEAREHQARTIELLYRLYSAEGLYLVEHLALRPRAVGDPFLSAPAPGGTPDPDPYSQRISFVLPSGHRRDFDAEDPNAGHEPAPPHRFADREFRAHAERMIRQACPAHLLPGIYWVDRRMPGNSNHPGCFEVFEERYHRWLESILIPETPSAEVSVARADLVASLNTVVRR